MHYSKVLPSLALSSALLCSPLMAFEQLKCDDGTPVISSDFHKLHVDDDSFSQNIDMLGSLVGSADTFNKNPSNARVHLRMGSGFELSFENGIDQVWLVPWDEINTDAATYSWVDCVTGTQIESDILAPFVFKPSRPNENWATSLTDKTQIKGYGGSDMPLLPVLLHEIGHVFSLDHTPAMQSIMGQPQSMLHVNGASVRPYLGPDASRGLTALFGERPFGSMTDISVSHWRFLKTDSLGYAQLARGRWFRESDGRTITAASWSVGGGSEGHTKLQRGETYLVEFTYENSGNTMPVFDFDFVISTNDYITKYDRVIESRSNAYLYATSQLTVRLPVTIPEDLESNRAYYLGALIDPDEEILGDNRNNNAAYLPFTIID